MSKDVELCPISVQLYKNFTWIWLCKRLTYQHVLQVLEHDDKNVAVLVQRALLYESMEKYKLGAEDLRTVMKLDPSNRVARSTVHRLSKMAE